MANRNAGGRGQVRLAGTRRHPGIQGPARRVPQPRAPRPRSSQGRKQPLYLARGGRRHVGGQRLVLVVGAAALLAIAFIVGRGLLTAAPSAEPEPKHVQIAATEVPGMPSTPDHLWGKGNIPYLYQIDERWAAKPYAGEDIETSGCGPTCLSMVYMGLTGKNDMDPVAMCRFSEENGYVEGDATRWALMDEGARALGLKSHGVDISPNAVKAALDAGETLIVLVDPGDFTTVGHFMVVTGIDTDNRLILHDPNSPQNSLLRWPMLQVLSQTAAIWSFSA